ncbi:MAG: hypothetical protein AAF518_21615 [Spirochaetota bacterium]
MDEKTLQEVYFVFWPLACFLIFQISLNTILLAFPYVTIYRKLAGPFLFLLFYWYCFIYFWTNSGSSFYVDKQSGAVKSYLILIYTVGTLTTGLLQLLFRPIFSWKLRPYKETNALKESKVPILSGIFGSLLLMAIPSLLLNTIIQISTTHLLGSILMTLVSTLWWFVQAWPEKKIKDKKKRIEWEKYVPKYFKDPIVLLGLFITFVGGCAWLLDFAEKSFGRYHYYELLFIIEIPLAFAAWFLLVTGSLIFATGTVFYFRKPGVNQ